MGLSESRVPPTPMVTGCQCKQGVWNLILRLDGRGSID